MKTVTSPTMVRHEGWRRPTAALALVLAGTLALAGCGATAAEEGAAAGTTITLAGPNQWNSDPNSFGPAWEDLIGAFESDTGVVVETTVLPVDQFAQTLSTQLAAGTAPELVFKQAPHKPELVHPLNSYLDQPNPFVEGNSRWWDVFVEEKFGPGIQRNLNPNGDTEFVPFNLVATGVYVNADAFAEAGLEAPIDSWEELIAGCDALEEAGYTPFAMDNSDLGLGWTMQTISNMLFAKYKDELNVYAPGGKEGESAQMTPKDWARAVLSGEVDATTTPEVRAAVELLKEFYDSCATENWSGVAPSGGGSVVGLDEFASGRAGMAWGVNFGFSALQDVGFEVNSMPFPTIGKAATPVSSGFEAQYGASTGGTSYMIPATVEGEELDAAVSFLQWMSVPENIQPWLDATGGIPALKEATAPEGTKGFAEGAWAEEMVTGGGMPAGPQGTTVQSVYDGFLLGRRGTDEQLAYMQELWIEKMRQQVDDAGWESEPWAAE